jgi:hypothetical protein
VAGLQSELDQDRALSADLKVKEVRQAQEIDGLEVKVVLVLWPW